MSGHDPFELLNDIDWDYDDRAVVPGEDPALELLLRRVSNRSPARRHSLLGGRIRVWVASLIAVAVVGTGAVVTAVVLTRAEDPTTFSCFSNAALEPEVRVAVTPATGVPFAEVCDPFWRDGTLGSNGPPPLSACVTPQRGIAVIPGPISVCREFGLDVAARPDAQDEQAIEVVNAVPELFLDVCLDDTDARARVEQVLAELNATEWAIVVDGPTTGDRPCAGPLIDTPSRTVRIIPGPTLPE